MLKSEKSLDIYFECIVYKSSKLIRQQPHVIFIKDYSCNLRRALRFFFQQITLKMSYKLTQYKYFIIFVMLIFSSSVLGQENKPTKKRVLCGHHIVIVKKVAPQRVAPKRVTIHLPPDYKPPVADQKLIIFPETVANKKKQKQLLKKRKKGKNHGCIATVMH
jgi:hypothetical protein